MWNLEYDSAVPPLPQPVGKRGGDRLTHGCWLLHVDPCFADDDELTKSWLLYYRGTLRVGPATDACPNARNEGVLASGDLYLKRQVWYETEGHHEAPPPLRPYWPPIFKRDEYRFYLRLTDLKPQSKGNGLELELDTYRLYPSSGTWSAFGRLTALVTSPSPPPQTWNGPFFSGELRNERGTLIGKLSMGWVSDLLRRATVEIDRTPNRTVPLKAIDLHNRLHTLKSIFADAGWEIEQDDSQKEAVPAPPDGVWSDKLLHEQMLKWRKKVNFDSEWRYYLLIVERLWQKPTLAFGKMYDADSIDSNLVPREGLAIAGGSLCPDTPMYGSARGKPLEQVPAAFLRAAVHELGHAMGLSHNFSSREFMQATDQIAENLNGSFPDNITWKFAPEDLVRLKHLPDPWVRPGGVPYGQGFVRLPVPLEDITSDASDEFTFEVIPLAHAVPLGAPVRLHLRLFNESQQEMPGPCSLSLSDGCVSGVVTGPGNVARSFASTKLLEGAGPARINSGALLEDDLILLRGADGSLFPTPGVYQISIDVIWVGPGGLAKVQAKAAVLISWPPTSADEPAAVAVLSCPEIAIPLIFRSNLSGLARQDQQRFDDGMAALASALKSPGLRPFWAAIEARRLAEAGGDSLDAIAALLREPVALTAGEIDTFLTLLQKVYAESSESLAFLQILGVLGAAIQDLTSRRLCPPSVAEQLRLLLAKLAKRGEPQA